MTQRALTLHQIWGYLQPTANECFTVFRRPEHRCFLGSEDHALARAFSVLSPVFIGVLTEG